MSYKTVIFLCATSLLQSCAGNNTYTSDNHDESFYQFLERAVFVETNLARTNPVHLLSKLQSQLKYYRGIYLQIPGQITIQTNEGKAAVDEAITVLNNQPPLQALAWSDQLAAAAKKHAIYTGRKGRLGHTGKNGSRIDDRARAEGIQFTLLGENIDYGNSVGEQVVMSLVIDDGVAGRGHRTNLFNADYTHSGVGCAAHRTYRISCVIMYARLR